MKRYIYMALLIGLCAVSQVFGAKVTNVRLSYENGATVARVDVDGPIRFAHQTEVPKDGKPDRMILDVLGATNEMTVKEFNGVPVCPVKGIRTSQYSVKPEKIARVVFDMTKAPIYSVTQDGPSIKIVFTDNGVKPFTSWAAVSTTPSATIAATDKAKPSTSITASAPLPTTTATTPSPAQQNKTAEQDRQNSLTSSQPTAASATQPKPATTPVVTTAKPQVTPVTPTAQPKPVVTASTPPPAAASKPIAVASPKETAVIANPAAKVETPAKPEAKPAAVTTVAQSSTPLPVAPKSDVKVENKPLVTTTEKTAAPATRPEVKPAAAPTSVTTPSPTIATSVTPVAKTTSPSVPSKPQSTAGEKTAVTAPGSATLSAISKSTSSEARSQEDSAEKPLSPAVSDSEAEGNSPEQLAEENVMPDLSDSTSYKSTARFRRNPANQAKIKGTMVAEFPKRLLVRYEAESYRDPFAPLVDDTRTNNNPFEARVPNVEGLRLVGIIESTTGDNRALLEDKSNYSYMLKSGDKVQKGYVLRVEEDKVYFQIFEYGWSRTIALTISENEGR